jgi:probable phosphoglycerate mutase
MPDPLPIIYLARHGETAWALTRQHTGLTDIPLTAQGEEEARHLGERLSGIEVALVLTSPLIRARQTCTIAGFAERAVAEPDLVEWDYGAYEGKTTAEIREKHPDWNIFRDGCPGGESLEQVSARADRVVRQMRENGGDVLIFSHKDMLRILAVRWLGLPAATAIHFQLGTSALSILGYDHSFDEPVIKLWNDRSFEPGGGHP